MGKKQQSSSSKKAKEKERLTVSTFEDEQSGDTLCDLSYPYAFVHQMTGLEIRAKKVTITDSEGVESAGLDLVEEYKLVEQDMTKEGFESWLSSHLRLVADTCLQQRIGAFK